MLFFHKYSTKLSINSQHSITRLKNPQHKMTKWTINEIVVHIPTPTQKKRVICTQKSLVHKRRINSHSTNRDNKIKLKPDEKQHKMTGLNHIYNSIKIGKIAPHESHGMNKIKSKRKKTRRDPTYLDWIELDRVR